MINPRQHLGHKEPLRETPSPSPREAGGLPTTKAEQENQETTFCWPGLALYTEQWWSTSEGEAALQGGAEMRCTKWRPFSVWGWRRTYKDSSALPTFC